MKPVSVTQNFDENLREIQSYFDERGAAGTVDDFLEDLEDRLIPLLGATPGVGSLFRPMTALPHDDQFVLSRMTQRLKGQELRQIVSDKFIVLYLVSARSVHLLAVRHHRQVAFRLG